MEYLYAFRNLRPNTKYGRKSPQKAILLLAIIELYETNVFMDNEITYNKALIDSLLKVWNKVLPEETTFLPKAYIPFWYMQNEDFWHVVPIHGKEDILLLLKDDQIRPSESIISDCVQYVELDEDLFFMLTMPSGRSVLKRALLETYSKLSDRMINKLSETSNNSVDSSAIAMNDYKTLLSSSYKETKQQLSQSCHGTPLFSQLNEEIQLSFTLEYYKFQKSHRQEREMFKELFPAVEELYNRIVVLPIKHDEVFPSFSFVYENFLNDLKFALMSEEGSMEIIDSINDAISKLHDDQASEHQENVAEEASTKDNASLTVATSDLDIHETTDKKPLYSAQENRNGKAWSKDEEKKLVTYYQIGYSVEEIAAAFGRTEISIKMRLSKLGMIDYVCEKDLEKFPATDVINTPVDFFVENESKQGCIYNKQGECVYSVNGQLKVFHGKVYRFNFKEVCFTVKDLVRHGNNWNKGAKRIVAYPDADLYKILTPNGFINQIEDVVESPIWENNRILVDRKWYDFEGNYIKAADFSKVDETTIEHDVSSSTDYIPKGKLKDIDKVAQNSYDYLWIVAIADFMSEKQQCLSLSYDNLACMMIANVWEILNEHSELRKQEVNLTDCINFLIEESKNFMDVKLDWSSPKDVVYYAIKNYPMAGVFEDTVEELIDAAPYNVLKAWIPTDDKQEMVFLSNSFHNACLYAIHPRKVDPYIEINPKWARSLFFEHSNLVAFLRQHYTDYLLIYQN